MLDWDDLRFFAELGRRGSLSETARRLRTDHSTVARRIANLERALGLKLFDRLPRGYALTSDGERLLERTGALEDAVFSIERLAGASGEEIGGRVRISAPPTFASHWLTPRLAALRARHRGLVLDLAGATASASLGRREADLALRMGRPSGEDLIARKLGDIRFGLYGLRSYVEETGEADRVFLGYDDELARSPQQTWLESIVGTRSFAFITNDSASLISAARAGMGLAALPHILAAQENNLVCVMDAPEATRELWLLVHADVRRAGRVRTVMDYLVEITADLRAPASVAS